MEWESRNGMGEHEWNGRTGMEWENRNRSIVFNYNVNVRYNRWYCMMQYQNGTNTILTAE